MIESLALFDTLLEPVFLLKEDNTIYYCNETASALTGLSKRKIMRGLKFNKIFIFNEDLECLHNMKSIRDSTPYKELSFKTEQNTSGKIQLTFQPFPWINAEFPLWIAFIRDVTLEETLQKKYRAELEEKVAAYDQLAQSHANLEKMVEERTVELASLNKMMQALLDSLSLGFFLFNKDGLCLKIHSKSCLNTIEQNPSDKYLWEVFNFSEEKTVELKKWLQILFDEPLPFEDIAPLGPDKYQHSQHRTIALKYYPIRDAENKIVQIVAVADDISSLVEAQKQAEYERGKSLLVINLLENKTAFSIFISDSTNMIAELKTMLTNFSKKTDFELLSRLLHTLKGGAATYHAPLLAHLLHESEDILSELCTNWEPVAKGNFLNKIQEVINEFDYFKSQIIMIAGNSILNNEKTFEVTEMQIQEIIHMIIKSNTINEAIFHVQSNILFTPFSKLMTPYNKVLITTAQKLNKQILPLQIKNGACRIPTDEYNELLNSLVHVFRNAIDHGIELPEERTLKNKNPAGQIKVTAEIINSFLEIDICDDGAGIDPQNIRKKLEEKGISTINETDNEVIQHIFDNQFSTKQYITDLSGRGIGMDAVAQATRNLGGNIWVQSQIGLGTQIHIQVPYNKNVQIKKVA